MHLDLSSFTCIASQTTSCVSEGIYACLFDNRIAVRSEKKWPGVNSPFVSVHEKPFITDLQAIQALFAVTLLGWSHFVLVRWACNWPQPPTRQLIPLLSLSYFRFISNHISVPLMSVHFALSFFLCEAGVNLRYVLWRPAADEWMHSPHLPFIHSAALKTLRWWICSLWYVQFHFLFFFFFLHDFHTV